MVINGCFILKEHSKKGSCTSNAQAELSTRSFRVIKLSVEHLSEMPDPRRHCFKHRFNQKLVLSPLSLLLKSSLLSFYCQAMCRAAYRVSLRGPTD